LEAKILVSGFFSAIASPSLSGKPAARLIAALPGRIQFPNRSELRASLPPVRESSAHAVRELRDEERY
jgi:hypothetical protein